MNDNKSNNSLGKLSNNEYKILVFSAFINEYIIKEEIGKNVALRKKIISSENENKRFSKYKIDKKRMLFIFFGAFEYLLFFFFLMYFIFNIFILVFDWGSNRLFLSLGLESKLANIYWNAWFYITKIYTTILSTICIPLKWIASLFNISINTYFFYNYKPFAIRPILITYLFVSFVIGLYLVIRNIMFFKKRNKIYKNKIISYKQKYNYYLSTYQKIIKEAKENLAQIYNLNIIPDKYHDFDNLSYIYGYFLDNRDITIDEAIELYTTDQKNNLLLSGLQEKDELIDMIARKAINFTEEYDEANSKLMKLINKNDIYLENNPLNNNLIKKIYENTKNNFNKINAN